MYNHQMNQTLPNSTTMISSSSSLDKDDSSSSSPVSSAPTSSGGGTSNRDETEAMYFALKESRHVRSLKLAVFAILFVVTFGVCFAIYYLTDNGQQDEFELAFEGAADKVLDSFRGVMGQKIGIITALGVAITSLAKQTNSTWPFVTIDDFQQRVESTRRLSGAIHIQLLPLVEGDNVEKWIPYAEDNKQWLDEGRQYQAKLGVPEVLNPTTEAAILPYIYDLHVRGPVAINGKGPYLPGWQQSPITRNDFTNYNLLGNDLFKDVLKTTTTTGKVSLGGLTTAPAGGFESRDALTQLYSSYLSVNARQLANYTGQPLSLASIPVMSSFEEDRQLVAILTGLLQWGDYLKGILTSSAQPVRAVLENTCDGAFTYLIDGPNVMYEGPGNRADRIYDAIAKSLELDGDALIFEKDTLDLRVDLETCPYTITVYPTVENDEHYNDSFPWIITGTVAAVFLFTAGVFLMYDNMVERRQRRIMDTAKRSTAIVSSIFPKNVRDQMMGAKIQGNATKLRSIANNTQRNVDHDSVDHESDAFGTSQPIADLFPECTVMFADVEGFTAWSSVREPSQVFTLLETLYSAFDRVASRRRVFKVETVGDCYLAVCGLPDPRSDHALVMARFARDCINEHIDKTKQLEKSLGPETGELRLRVGLHSGPITAGVLRSERSRFQLFGDTVNTGARLETSGEGNRIHVSETTASLVRAAGLGHWVTEREDVVQLKGKGEMKTFWLSPVRRDTNASGELSADSCHTAASVTATRQSFDNGRLVSWNADVLLRLLKQIIASRENVPSTTAIKWKSRGTMPLDEVKEIIELPEQTSGLRQDPASITLDTSVAKLVHEYVAALAKMYRKNPFHNFEHASHVTMSVAKLLSRIVAPSDMDFSSGEDATKELHDHTYGITSDPLTQFACVLAALIHDVDHQGVSNSTLALEDDPLVANYGGKSMAEQNSVDQAWTLLMSEHYRPLVTLLCRDQSELCRLRQLVVNSVMATDIMDPDLKKLRNDRWEKAFSSKSSKDSSRDVINRKATIVIEHLIQASDVSHTMQHWNVYTKWNSRLFKEMYKAYLDGRSGANDPSDFWAKGEIGFFDFYIIPLAKKLKECGVFGVSSDEYLQYAVSNRNEWERKGETMVQRLIEEVQAEYGKVR